MITEEQTITLCKLINERDDARELMGRYHQGYTNYSFDHCAAREKNAKEALDAYMKTIQEPQMDDGYEPPHGESFKLKASVQTYELSVPDLQRLIGKELGVPYDRVTITANSREIGDGDRYSNVVFDGLSITVRN